MQLPRTSDFVEFIIGMDLSLWLAARRWRWTLAGAPGMLGATCDKERTPCSSRWSHTPGRRLHTNCFFFALRLKMPRKT